MQKKCRCGNYFIPRLEKQSRCMRCILKHEPKAPPEDDRDINSTQFVEWFIYRWHHIREAAAKARGVTFEYDDGIVGRAVEVPKDYKPNVTALAKKCGLKPRTVHKRLALGWTLDEALGKKQRKKRK